VQLGLKGITVLAASGDGGVCGVMDPCKDEHLMFPSCSEFITSVGGTNGFKVWKQYGFSSGGGYGLGTTPEWQKSALEV